MNGSLFINKTYSRNELKGLLESVLFVNGKPVLIDELERVFETSKKDIAGLIEEINDDYNTRKSGFTILSVAGGYQLFTNPYFKDELMELFGRRNENRLPKSALETLAIIAYKQPVTKEDIDKIRGVSGSRSINTLLALKLITISGSSDGLIKSPLYITTNRFLEFFRIKNIEDLPPLSSLDSNKFYDDFEDVEEQVYEEEISEDNIFDK